MPFGIIPMGPPSGTSSEHGTTSLHGGSFNIHPSASIKDLAQLYPHTAGMSLHPRNEVQKLVADLNLRRQLLHPPVSLD